MLEPAWRAFRFSPFLSGGPGRLPYLVYAPGKRVQGSCAGLAFVADGAGCLAGSAAVDLLEHRGCPARGHALAGGSLCRFRVWCLMGDAFAGNRVVTARNPVPGA